MTTSLNSLQPLEQSAPPEGNTIQLDYVGISQLLGRDYILINNDQAKLPLDSKNVMAPQFEGLINQLKLVGENTFIISFQEPTEGEMVFTRHDINWTGNKVNDIANTLITDDEQLAFMLMIWQSSTPL